MPARIAELMHGTHGACTSARTVSDLADRSIFAKTPCTTWTVARHPITDPMLVAAAPFALLIVPSSETISTIRRAAPDAHGRSWQRKIRNIAYRAPSRPLRAQLIDPGACSAVPVKS